MSYRTHGRFTPFPELNAVLAHLVDGAQRRLGENFIGAYVQGSFAVGDFTEYSDCDFIIVLARDLTPDEIPALNAFHEQIHALPYTYWNGNLEGSYAPAAVLRRWSPVPRDPPGEPRGDDWKDPGLSGSPARGYPFWYLDHGSRFLVRSEHDNTNVVRWSLRERGVTLAGPDPKTLIDVVPADLLKRDARETLDRALAVNLEPMHLAAWQAFWVGLFCRALHTLETGEVTSKKAAMTWAQTALEDRWRPLIAAAQAMRKGDDTVAAAPVAAETAAETRAFARYAVAFADMGR